MIALDYVIWLQRHGARGPGVLAPAPRASRPDFDLTTDVSTTRILLSMLIKFAAIAVLGPPVIAVLIFEVLLNATSMFNHGNVHVPAPIERFLRWFVVTPDMHRVHHSVEEDGPIPTSAWPATVGPFTRHLSRATPRRPADMTIGIHGFTDRAR